MVIRTIHCVFKICCAIFNRSIMNFFILAHLLFGLFERNKYSRSFYILDCQQQLDFKGIFNFTSTMDVLINVVDLDAVRNISHQIESIKKQNQLGVILNYNCRRSKEIIEKVKILLIID